ncbi:DUF202 domain-containing protein [Streptomyces sp. WG-D5]
MSGTGGAVRDPGLQPARTRLAWRRTTLSGTVVAVLALKATVQSDTGAVRFGATALCLLLWLGFVAVAHQRITGLARDEAAPPVMTRRQAAAAALCTVAITLCAAALIT